MVNGEAGKTHFWNNKVKERIESLTLNGKKYTTIYMSLYGISDLEEISKSIREYLIYYNYARIHTTLRMTPIQMLQSC